MVLPRGSSPSRIRSDRAGFAAHSTRVRITCTRRGRGQGPAEAAALAQLGLHGQVASQGAGESARHGQAHAAALAARAGRVGPEEPFEHALQVLRGDAGTRVLHRDLHPARVGVRADLHPAARRRVPQRVAQPSSR